MSAPSRAYAWLHDDTEEDLVGSDWHQRAINGLYNSLRDLATLNGFPWHVGNQLTLTAWKPDNSPWRPSPDIMVHPQAGPEPRDEMSARDDGPPALIVEVASAATWRYDVDAQEGKAAGYMNLGVQNYLVFDPTGVFLQLPCRGWRRAGEGAQPWEPSSDGRYECQALGISLRPDGDLMRVFDAAGRPIAYDHEKIRELRRRDREIEALRAELAQLKGVAPPTSAKDDGTPAP